MILLDTSAWIEFLNNKKINFEDLQKVTVCLPVLQEVLQGIKQDKIYLQVKKALLSMPCLCPNMDYKIYIDASEIYRIGRKKGFTIRSATDCLIASIAIKNNIPIMHFDRDFNQIAKFTNLNIVKEW